MAYRNYTGKVKLKNESKYLGDPSNVIYRSSWENFFSRFCDTNDNVVLVFRGRR